MGKVNVVAVVQGLVRMPVRMFTMVKVIAAVVGAKVLDCDAWLDEQFDRQRRQQEANHEDACNPDPDIKQRELSDEEKWKWLKDFGF